MSIVSTASRLSGRGLLIAKKYSPEILTGAGILGLLASGVLASRATLKLDETLLRAEDRVELNRELKRISDESEQDENSISEHDHKRAMTKVYFENTADMVKLYGPSVTLAVASTISILGGQHIIRQRNVALVAAYKTLESSFAKYRERVVEELGLDKDFAFANGIREVEVLNEETGKTETVHEWDEYGISPYAKIFERGNPNWQGAGPDFNMAYLKGIQNQFNDKLRMRGHVYLNEVYSALGFEHTKEGAIIGWVTGGEGDDYIDFGISEEHLKRAHKLLDGSPNTFLLDFNVDGVMWDKI